jgi:non-specific serine/threonine protein kinase
MVRGHAGRAGLDWPAGLPAPLTAFVGRAGELASIARLVAAHRLVTLVGAGGVGKTRTAIEVAAGMRAMFGDGVNLVDLSAVPDPRLLPGVAARALGVEDRAADGLEERLVRVLRPQRRLIVLDNCESLRPACAALAGRLHTGCPGVSVLATSRQRLAVAGEITWRVPSLTFPWPEHPPALDELVNFEAAALLLDRARAARPDLAITVGDVAAVTAICFHLDGIPLALELAAARAGAMSLTEIAERLTGRFELLAGSGPGPARHQTLRASVEWSCALLSAAERALFARLAIFAGGWSLDAAEAVCAGGPVPRAEVARLLAALVDKSLVQVDQSRVDSRYRLLATIRVFAQELLAGAGRGELDRVRAGHGRYFAGLAGRAAPGLLGPDQARWAARLDLETGNLRAARAWCGEDPARAGLRLRLEAGLWEYWHIRGRLADGTRWLTEALAAAPRPAKRGLTVARAAALNGLGVIVSLRGEHQRGSELFAESVAEYQRTGDLRGESRAWADLGNARTILGDRAGADEAYVNALELARRSGDRWYEATALMLSGWARAATGDTAVAVPRLTASARMFGEIGDRRAVGYVLSCLGDCELRAGRLDSAVRMLREAVSVFEDLPDRWGLLHGASLLTVACAAMGDWPQVGMLLGVMDSLTERTGAQLFPQVQEVIDAHAAEAARQLGPALERSREAGRVAGRGDRIAAALWPGPDRAPRPPAGLAAQLTKREREVAELITEGLTNREIGARLFIAERTVDTHVSRILAKLGCSSRAQVAATVAAAGTAPDAG